MPGTVRQGHFSLIELMAVTAIILTLVTLLLPPLIKAQRAARRAYCLSNLRQIGMAVHFYGMDNGGQAPSGWDGFEGLLINHSLDLLWLCPSDRLNRISRIDNATVNGDNSFFASYFMPVHAMAKHPRKYGATAPSPSTTTLAWDLMGGGMDSHPEMWRVMLSREEALRMKSHESGGQVLFLDGHATYVPEYVWFLPNAPARIGHFMDVMIPPQWNTDFTEETLHTMHTRREQMAKPFRPNAMVAKTRGEAKPEAGPR